MVKLATWMAMGAAATVASASCAASAVLYRGDVFMGEGDSGTSRLLRFLFFRKGLPGGEPQTHVPPPPRSGPGGVAGGERQAQEGAEAAAKAGKKKGKKGSRAKGARRRRMVVLADGPVDPLLRRRALPTAVKALGISTAMAATVGSAAAAMLFYAVEGGAGEGDGDAAAEPVTASSSSPSVPAEEVVGAGAGAAEGSRDGGESHQKRQAGSSIRQFLEDSFKKKS